MIIALLAGMTVKVSRRAGRLRKYPKHAGLRTITSDALDQLRYQMSFGASAEASGTVSVLSAKIGQDRKFETRPLSLPGLSAKFADYLKNVGEVFGGRVVICLDELDKIADPDQLDELLKGIKGVMGSQNTHFILTVAEDAVARYGARKRSTRDLMESSFDDLVVLDRVRVDLAQAIVSTSLALPEALGTPIVATLCWIFGAGVPREMKRCANLLTERLGIISVDAFHLWLYLFCATLDEMERWVVLTGGDDEGTFQFLALLQATRGNAPTTIDRSDDWVRSEIRRWSDVYPEVLGNKLGGEATQVQLRYARAALEILIDASALLVCRSGFDVGALSALHVAFETVSTNLSYAGLQFALFNSRLSEL